MTQEPPIQPNNKSKVWQVLTFALLATTGALAVILWATNPTYGIEPRSNYAPYADTNQTRVELLDIIESQRIGVYGSYPLEWAFCMDRVEEGQLASTDRSDVQVDGTTITELVHCGLKSGQVKTYVIEFDAMTGEYTESIKFRVPAA